MNRNLFVSCALISSMALAGCAGMSDTERRVTTGAAAGAASGYLYDQSQKNEQKAYERGVKDGQKK